MAYMPATSKEDLFVKWGVEAVGLPVEIAVIPHTTPEREPVDAEYKTASWDGATGWALLLIGAGSAVVLTPAEYVVWSRVTSGARKPVRRHGYLTIGVS
jgi:hypothetical protein